MLYEDAVAHRDLADAPALHRVAVPRHVHRPDSTIAAMSAPGIFRRAAGRQRADSLRTRRARPSATELQRRLEEMAGERISIPLVIGGERVETDDDASRR